MASKHESSSAISNGGNGSNGPKCCSAGDKAAPTGAGSRLAQQQQQVYLRVELGGTFDSVAGSIDFKGWVLKRMAHDSPPPPLHLLMRWLMNSSTVRLPCFPVVPNGGLLDDDGPR